MEAEKSYIPPQDESIKYTEKKKIGEGTYGKIYRVIGSKGREFALKKMPLSCTYTGKTFKHTSLLNKDVNNAVQLITKTFQTDEPFEQKIINKIFEERMKIKISDFISGISERSLIVL